MKRFGAILVLCIGENSAIIIAWMLNLLRHRDPIKVLWLERQLRMFREKNV